MKANPCSWGAAVRVDVLSLICSSTARAVDFIWNVSGPATWENANNWVPTGVPNGPNDVAIFEDLGAFGSPVTIDQDGSLGSITSKLQYDNAFEALLRIGFLLLAGCPDMNCLFPSDETAHESQSFSIGSTGGGHAAPVMEAAKPLFITSEV